MTTLETSVQASPDLTAAIKGLKPEVMARAIARGMRRGTLLIAGRIQSQRLSGKGPFPASQQRLGVVTGRLRQSVRASEPVFKDNEVVTSIGSVVKYAKTHEFGFAGSVKVKAHEVTMTSLFGRKLAQPLRFSRLPSQRKMSIAERRPFRAGITEHIGLVEREVAREIAAGFKGGSQAS